MFTADDIARIHDLSSDSDASEDEDMVEVPDGKYVCCLVTGAVHILHYLSFENFVDLGLLIMMLLFFRVASKLFSV